MPDLDGIDTCMFSVEPGQPRERMMVSILAVMRRFSQKQKWGKIWISFYGYDEDKREVWEIDEVKDWARDFVKRVRSSADPVAMLRTLGDDRAEPGMMGRIKLLILGGMGQIIPVEGGAARFEASDEADQLLAAVEAFV